MLVEKPIALTLDDADRVLRAIEKRGANVRVAYSRRYKERYLIAKEQIVQGRIGALTGGAARVYNSRSQAFAIMERNPHATPVVDALTYYVDLMNWFFEGKRIVEVYARGQTGVLKAAGYDAPDVNFAVFTYDDGSIVNLGICYALPEKYPALGHAARVELLGTEGVMLLDDDHTDQLMYTRKRRAARLSAGPQRQHGVPAERHAGRLGAGRISGAHPQRDARLARPSGVGQALRAGDAATGPRDAGGDAGDRIFGCDRATRHVAASGQEFFCRALNARPLRVEPRRVPDRFRCGPTV